MSIERVNPEMLAKAQGFSHAVKAQGGLVFLAGQTGTDGTGQIIPGGLVAQFEQAMGNLLAALTAAGGRPDQLASLTIYACDIEEYRAHAADIGRVWRRLVGTDYPAMAAVEVARLWDVEAVVEIQGVAVVS